MCLENFISYKNHRILDITEPNCFIFQITKLRLIKINEFPRIILPVSKRKSNYQVVHTLKDFPHGSDDKESTCNARDLGSIPGLGRSLGKGLAIHSISCLANPMDRGWRSTVPGVAKCQTRLRDFRFTSDTLKNILSGTFIDNYFSLSIISELFPMFTL